MKSLFKALVVTVVCSSPLLAQESGLDPALIEAFNKVLPPKAEVECVEVELPNFLDLVDQSKITQRDYCKDGMYQRISSDNEVSHSNSDNVGVYLFRENDDKERPIASHKIVLKKAGEPFKSQIYGMIYNEKKKKSSKGLIVSEKENKLVYPVRELTQYFTGRNKEHVLRVVDQAVLIEKKPNQQIERDVTPLEPRVIEYTFFPRKVVPAVKMVGEDVEVYLTTGEKVVFNGKTGRPKSGGAFHEVSPEKPVEVKKGSKTLVYPSQDLLYKGDGLYIENPVTASQKSKVTVKANVGGEVQTCEFDYSDIWRKSSGADKLIGKWSCTYFSFEKDEDLYKMIREKCPEFKFPKLFIVNDKPSTPAEGEVSPAPLEENKEPVLETN